MIIDHIGFSVSDKNLTIAFFDKVLAPLDIKQVMDVNSWVGYGIERPEIWFTESDHIQDHLHIAVRAKSRQQVDNFFETAINAGAECHKEPNIRKAFHPDYYSASIVLPDRHHLEVICHHQE